MNIIELIKELRDNLRKNKKVQSDNIKSLWSFFYTGNPYHITQYQEIIQKYGREIFALDEIIKFQEGHLDRL